MHSCECGQQFSCKLSFPENVRTTLSCAYDFTQQVEPDQRHTLSCWYVARCAGETVSIPVD